MAQGLLEKVQQSSIEEEEGSEGEEEDETDNQQKPNILEGISEEYKLFEVVTSAFPK